MDAMAPAATVRERLAALTAKGSLVRKEGEKLRCVACGHRCLLGEGHVFRHTQRGLMTVEQLGVFLAWHARHHTAHITSLRERMGWS